MCQNDQFYISHKHQPEDGFANLEDFQDEEPRSEDNASTSSVVRSSPYLFRKQKPPSPVFSMEEITTLTKLATEVRISSEVRAYLHDIVVFMRMHRAVGGGISALATRHFALLSQ